MCLFVCQRSYKIFNFSIQNKIKVIETHSVIAPDILFFLHYFALCILQKLLIFYKKIENVLKNKLKKDSIYDVK